MQSKKMVNGISDSYTQFNGFGCMIAQYISKFKGNEAGNLYIYPVDATEDMYDDYVYYVTYYKNENENEHKLTIQIGDGKEVTLDKYEETYLNYDDSF